MGEVADVDQPGALGVALVVLSLALAAVIALAIYFAINNRTVAPPSGSNSSTVDSTVSPEPPCYRHPVPCR